ncbi:MAG: hypothetical protein KZQ86_04410, partial [Candidatus Thiodiazotropha sp. (ex Lucinoma kastoroae)]|nr:hypothetical protein [Candidatus Thiodiazotropha sp. (ex Lucinoma kastoroae)]
QLSDPALYQSTASEEAGRLQQQMNEVQQHLDQAYERWENLEALQTGA